MNTRAMAAMAAAMVGLAEVGAERPRRDTPRIDAGFLHSPRKGTRAQQWRKYKHAMGRSIRARIKAGGSRGDFGKHLKSASPDAARASE